MSALQPPQPSKSSWWSRPRSIKDLPSVRTPPSLPTEKLSPHTSTASSKSSTGSKFNTFVSSAIGKKSKKPILTIQEPPPATSVRPSPSSFASRSTSTIAETTPLNSPQPPPSEHAMLRYYDIDQSSDFHTISEPRTPSDHPRDRASYQHSVLTLSDPDPFASGAVLFSPFAQDLNRSSVYSDNSLLDPNSKRPDLLYNNRISYGSSSSNSYSNPSDGHGARSSTWSAGGRSQGSRRPSEASSRMPELHRRQTSTGVESMQVPSAFVRSRNNVPSQPTDGSNSSHSTITDRNRRSTPGNNGLSGIPRSIPPPVRPRGMTVGGGVRPSTASGGLGFSTISGFSSLSPGPLRRKVSETFSSGRAPSDTGSPISTSPITFTRTRTSSTDTNSTTFPVSATSSTSASRPVVLVRKASSSRLLVPPLNAAPPNADLPPTPASPSRESGFMDSLEDIQAELCFPEPPSSSASSLSFASQLDLSDIGGDAIHRLLRDSFVDRVITGSYPDLSPSATVKNFSVSTSLSSSSRQPPTPSINTTPQKTLRKAISQSSVLGKRHSATSVASSVFSNEEPVPTPVKTPKKQRSFHHTRIPLPPLPSLRHASSQQSTTAPVLNESPTSSQFSPMEQKKPTTSPPHARKRLFSGSSLRRNSSSQQHSPTMPPSPDDDMRSITSLESRTSMNDRRAKPIMMSFATFGNHISLVTDNACIAPSWDEPPPLRPSPIKRESTSEYVPQYIMSPEALLKLEEELAAESEHKEHGGPQRVTSMQSHSTPKLQLEPADLGLQQSPSRRPISARSRTSSALSGTSTALAFSRDDPLALASNGTLQSLSSRSRATSARSDSRVGSDVDSARFGFRSNSVLAKPVDKHPRMRRPSTTQSSMSSPNSPNTTRHHSPERPATALPPPPRPRPTVDQPPRERTNSNPYKRASIMPINPLSPPPRRKNSQPSTVRVNESRERERDRDRESVLPHAHTQTHIRPGQSTRPPSSFDPQKVLQRRSIMKKPSFLEIEDEMDSESGGEMERLVDMSLEPLAASPIMESSFLDLDRGNSFDSFRSDDGVGVF